MTKDWVHGVGHSPVCQILPQIVFRAVITSSPPALTSSAKLVPARWPTKPKKCRFRMFRRTFPQIPRMRGGIINTTTSFVSHVNYSCWDSCQCSSRVSNLILAMIWHEPKPRTQSSRHFRKWSLMTITTILTATKKSIRVICVPLPKREWIKNVYIKISRPFCILFTKTCECRVEKFLHNNREDPNSTVSGSVFSVCVYCIV